MDRQALLRQLFDDFYKFLDTVAEQHQDTLWYNLGTTAHEALIDLAAQYDPAIEAELQVRLERDCDFTSVAT